MPVVHQPAPCRHAITCRRAGCPGVAYHQPIDHGLLLLAELLWKHRYDGDNAVPSLCLVRPGQARVFDAVVQMAPPQLHLLQPAGGWNLNPAIGHPCKPIDGQLALQGPIGFSREEFVRLQLHAHAQRQLVLASMAFHSSGDIEQVASARARRDRHPAAVLARRCLTARRAGSAAVARLPLSLAGCAFVRGRDPGEPEMLPDVAGASAFTAIGSLQLQATAGALGAVFDHLASNFPDATGHYLLEREADGVLDGGLFRTGGGIFGLSLWFGPGVEDHFQRPIDTLNLSQGVRAVVAIRVPACGQAAPCNLHLGIAGAWCQAEFVVRVVEVHDLTGANYVAAQHISRRSGPAESSGWAGRTSVLCARISLETRGRLQSHGISGVQSRHYDGHDQFDEKLESLETVFLLLEAGPERGERLSISDQQISKTS